MGGDALSGRCKTEPLADVRSLVRPHDSHLVVFRDQMLDGEARIEGCPDHADALLEALNSLALLREWIVLDVVRPGDLIQELELALIRNFLVKSCDVSFDFLHTQAARAPVPEQDP
jgi:hypothetical protein